MLTSEGPSFLVLSFLPKRAVYTRIQRMIRLLWLQFHLGIDLCEVVANLDILI